MSAITGTRREISSKRSICSGIPARRAIATRWITAFVEPPNPACATIALSSDCGETILSGVRSSQIISTMRRPDAVAMRGCAESAAGIDDAPGSVKPSASVSDIIVAAVPIVMHVPNERAMPPSIWCQSSSVMSPARLSSQYFQLSVPEPSTSPCQFPRSIGPAGTAIAGTPAEIAPISSAGSVLSQPPSSTTPSIGWLRISSSVSIARKLR